MTNVFENYLVIDSEDNIIDIRGNASNAMLISTAPELLDALKILIPLAEDGIKYRINCSSRVEFIQEWDNRIINAKKLIEQAE